MLDVFLPFVLYGGLANRMFLELVMTFVPEHRSVRNLGNLKLILCLPMPGTSAPPEQPGKIHCTSPDTRNANLSTGSKERIALFGRRSHFWIYSGIWRLLQILFLKWLKKLSQRPCNLCLINEAEGPGLY